MDNGRPPRLGDLFVVRTPEPVEFSNGTDSVFVHIVKLNAPDAEAVELRSQAARARRFAMVNDPESDEYIAHESNVDQMTPQEMVDLLVSNDMQEATVEVPLRVQARKKWAENDHLRTLMDAWYGDEHQMGLMYAFVGGEDAIAEESDEIRQQEMVGELVEARRVWDLLLEYQNERDEALEERRVEVAEEYENDGDLDDPEHVAKIREATLKMMRRLDADLVYLEESRRQKVFYCTRQAEDWRKRYFSTLAEVDELDEPVLKRIMDIYTSISLSASEGKGSPGIPGSSTSSDSSDEEAPSPQSGLATAST